MESDVAIGAALSERVLVFLGAEEPEVPAIFEPEVDWLLGFLAAKIAARFFQRADERVLHDGPQKLVPNHVGGLTPLWKGITSHPKMIREQRGSVKNRTSVSFEPQKEWRSSERAVERPIPCLLPVARRQGSCRWLLPSLEVVQVAVLFALPDRLRLVRLPRARLEE